MYNAVQVCRQDAMAMAAGRGRGGARRPSSKQKTTLDDAAWSSDDSLIITAECPESERSVEGTVGSHVKASICTLCLCLCLCWVVLCGVVLDLCFT